MVRWAVFSLLTFVTACTHAVGRHEPTTSRTAPVVSIQTRGRGEWARAFPLDSGFKRYVVPNGGRVTLTWRISAPPSGQAVDLLVAGDKSVVVALGDFIGGPLPSGLTYCKDRGVPANGRWDPPSNPDFASTFTLAANASRHQFLVVRDGPLLHVLSRHENLEARCETMRQGPLDACRGHEYTRLAEIEIGTAGLWELVDDRGNWFDCHATPETWFP